MNKRKLTLLFKTIKKECEFDYAITNTDDYGDCNSCVNSKLISLYGKESKGIYVIHWLKGMNKGAAWKDVDEVYIAHDITEKQAEKMINIFKNQGYHIQPETYNPMASFKVKEM